MSTSTLPITEAIQQYLVQHTLREPDIFKALREETAKLTNSNMQIAPEQGQFMRLLVELLGAKKAIEVGTFTGYSTMSVAAGLPDDGTLIACDVSEEWTSIARRYWQEAELANKIDLRIAPALETLDALIAGGHAETFDFAFIDADKTPYDAYYERCLTLIRHGGLIAIDNAFCGGRVAQPPHEHEGVAVIDALNRKIQKDERVFSSLVPIGDGLMLARKL